MQVCCISLFTFICGLLFAPAAESSPTSSQRSFNDGEMFMPGTVDMPLVPLTRIIISQGMEIRLAPSKGCARDLKNEMSATGNLSQENKISNNGAENCAIYFFEKKWLQLFKTKKMKLHQYNSSPVITSIAALRERLGISQYTLAEYLSIPRSLLSHVELGTRMLPDAAIFKLARLESAHAFVNAFGLRTPSIPGKPEGSKLIASWELKLLTNQQSISDYAYKLASTKQSHARALQWYAVLDKLSEETPDSPATAAWLKCQQLQTERVIANNNIETQMELQLKLDLLIAENEVIQRALERR
ncbi:MAG: hypothetical protein JWQ27_750 [Ferruginibacter sp.]|nr:hypothetical protein [Ferruginibacter sp.]